MSTHNLEMKRFLAVLIGSLNPKALDTDFKPVGILDKKDWTEEDLGRPVVAMIRHGGDDQRPPKVSTKSATEKAECTKDVNQFAAALRATTNPDITSPESLQHCEDTGFKLSEFLSKGGITVDQLVFLSSPSNRALTTSDCVISGIKHFYASADAPGETAVSNWKPSVLVLDELGEQKAYDQREWRAKKSEIAERYPSADVSRLSGEDPAQTGDLHLEPEANTSLTAEEFLSINRGISESDDDFERRVDTAKEILGQVIQSQCESLGKQPVLVVTSHCLFITQFLSGQTHTSGFGYIRHNAQCHVGSYVYRPGTTANGPEENTGSSTSA